jgi:hypothetical protein
MAFCSVFFVVFCLGELQIDYKHTWLQHVLREEEHRLPKQVLKYHPTGRQGLDAFLED